MIRFNINKHYGVVLEPTPEEFDACASAFCCFFKEINEKKCYLFYSGAADTEWSTASIGVATSQDGITFSKLGPILSVGAQSVTPAVFKALGKYYMVFAFKTKESKGRRLGIALSDDPKGPWKFIQQLIEPTLCWEGNSIDLGPSVVHLSENEVLIYYSNVPPKLPTRSFIFSRKIYRQIGILILKISSNNEILAKKFPKNPLKHLNGSKGEWNESLFCPGYLYMNNKHFLLPSASTYSIGYPFRQYIGLVESSSPFFENILSMRILIDGYKMKPQIFPEAKDEIALDTPSPWIKENEIWLYYSIMDRHNKIWKTALTTLS